MQVLWEVLLCGCALWMLQYSVVQQVCAHAACGCVPCTPSLMPLLRNSALHWLGVLMQGGVYFCAGCMLPQCFVPVFNLHAWVPSVAGM